MAETQHLLIASLPEAPRKPKSKVQKVVSVQPSLAAGSPAFSSSSAPSLASSFPSPTPLETHAARYGLATPSGLMVMDGTITLTEEEKEKYKLRFIDFLHAIMSMLVFFAISMFDQNVIRCLFPVPSEDTKELLTGLPFIIGVVCGGFFLVFPTRRHGIGSPLTKE
ncbi:protein DMP7 isoform X2 [Raphanus sativus]|uniref:Protein DMP7 isoform X2 n=1 Tax=Raphanus sativus TaxID=3726 RepID=A0A6J0N0G6_RAPSA|nr:protein DMP7 isoform X2 [Raphanus sativus]